MTPRSRSVAQCVRALHSKRLGFDNYSRELLALAGLSAGDLSVQETGGERLMSLRARLRALERRLRELESRR
jgi:hypothetical protein